LSASTPSEATAARLEELTGHEVGRDAHAAEDVDHDRVEALLASREGDAGISHLDREVSDPVEPQIAAASVEHADKRRIADKRISASRGRIEVR
jgi:hypothetical protein